MWVFVFLISYFIYFFNSLCIKFFFSCWCNVCECVSVIRNRIELSLYTSLLFFFALLFILWNYSRTRSSSCWFFISFFFLIICRYHQCQGTWIEEKLWYSYFVAGNLSKIHFMLWFFYSLVEIKRLDGSKLAKVDFFTPFGTYFWLSSRFIFARAIVVVFSIRPNVCLFISSFAPFGYLRNFLMNFHQFAPLLFHFWTE